MSCLLSKGRTRACRGGRGGIKHVFFANFSEWEALTKTYDADEQMTAISAALTVYKYALRPKAGVFDENYKPSSENGTMYYEQVLDINLNMLTKEDRKELKLMARNLLVIFVEDMNGNLVIMGKNGGAELSGGATKYGRNAADMSGYNLQFMAEETDPANFVAPYTAVAFDNIVNVTVDPS